MKYAFLLAALVFAGCDNYTQPPTQFKCPDGVAPVKVQPGNNYISIQCQDGSVHMLTVSNYNQTYGSQYTSGQDMLADVLMWHFLFGPSYYSYPYYHSYMASPYYTRYRPSAYVINNRTVIHNYGGNVSRAYAARTMQVKSYTINRQNSSSSYRSGSYSSGRTFSTYSRSSGGFGSSRSGRR